MHKHPCRKCRECIRLERVTETHELRIAVIGAGPAGVYSSDIFLRQLKKLGEELGLGTAARIDLFEKLPVPFGLVRYGVAPDHPSIKFIASALEKTLDNPDIHLYCDVEFGKDVTLDELLERYDAVLFATGAVEDKPLGLPGADLDGVYGAAKFVEWYDGYPTGAREWPLEAEEVAVIGGGNVAMDVCRSAVRLGADETYVLYRRSEAELPADPEEVKEAMEEGVQFRFLTAPVEILGADGKVTGIRVERMTLGEPDEKGRRKPVGTGEFETLAVDSVIGAIGQTVDWGTLDTGALTTTKKGTAEADALTYQTAQPDIFVGGDCYTGPKFAIDAIAAGKEAAISLHRYVHPGQTLTAGRDRRVYKALDKDHVLIETAGFDKDHRQTPGYNAAKAKTFSDARVTFTEEQVRKECARCLGCGATKVDSYLCIGCGLCTTKCKFDAIHLKKVRDWHAGSYETMPIKVAEGVVKRAGSIVKKAVSK